ncbi:MAG TPA: glycosyltransferase family 4 protein [Polyangiaceae bacterium]|jgi:phosphatidylinositol alpha-mannosyltransferase|nr:glycosyltransferase family 4 protein [Polyangiaceae bacterium]
MISLRRGTPLRVCIVAPYDLAARGGVKHHIVGLASALRARGDSVDILGPASQPVHEEGVFTTGGIISLESNGSANEIPIFASPLETLSFFQSRPFDVIHVHEPSIPSLAYWATWLTPGIPKLCTFHAYADAPPLLLRIGQKFFGALQFPFYARGLAVSEAAAEYAARAWKRPLSVVPNGVDTDLFAPSTETGREQRTVRLLFVGRLGDTRKGWRVMLDAYQRLLANGANVTLDVVGDSSGVPSLPSLPGLRAHGPLALSELVERYRACDLFVAPSISQESFGIVLLEAMATGRAIVCSDIRGYREVAKPEGAAFVRPNDSTLLASTIASLALDPSRRVAMQIFNLASVGAYRWPVLAEQVREHYLAAIASARHSGSRPQRDPALEGSFSLSTSKRLASTNPANNTGTV